MGPVLELALALMDHTGLKLIEILLPLLGLQACSTTAQFKGTFFIPILKGKLKPQIVSRFPSVAQQVGRRAGVENTEV